MFLAFFLQAYWSQGRSPQFIWPVSYGTVTYQAIYCIQVRSPIDIPMVASKEERSKMLVARRRTCAARSAFREVVRGQGPRAGWFIPSGNWTELLKIAIEMTWIFPLNMVMFQGIPWFCSLAGWWYTYPSEKYGKNKKCSKPPTRIAIENCHWNDVNVPIEHGDFPWLCFYVLYQRDEATIRWMLCGDTNQETASWWL